MKKWKAPFTARFYGGEYEHLLYDNVCVFCVQLHPCIAQAKTRKYQQQEKKKRMNTSFTSTALSAYAQKNVVKPFGWYNIPGRLETLLAINPDAWTSGKTEDPRFFTSAHRPKSFTQGSNARKSKYVEAKI